MRLSRLLITTFFTLWLATSITFFALRLLPGDAISTQLQNSNATPEEIAARRSALGLDAPIIEQYIRYAFNLLRGQLGASLLDGQPVQQLLAPRLGASAGLALSAMIIAIGIGIPLGLLSAAPKAGIWGSLARSLVHLSLAAPIYWTATLMLFLTTALSESDWIRGLLPVIVLGYGAMGSIARLLAAELRLTLRADFIPVAQAKGLHPRAILFRHATRVALLPIVSVVAVQMGWLMGGTVMTEAIFNRPGLGRLLLDRTLHQDYPVVQGIVIYLAIVFTLVNSFAELAYRWLDPRIRAPA